jgi:hypothetical protein
MAGACSCAYAAANRPGNPLSDMSGGGEIVQSAHPRDIAAVAFVIGVLLVLFVLSLILGQPTN